MKLIPRRKKQGPALGRQLGLGALGEALARVQPSPPKIYNPRGGTRSHYLDPDSGRPVCNASGSQWAEGDGGLKLCGLCPHMLAQRQAGSEGQVA